MTRGSFPPHDTASPTRMPRHEPGDVGPPIYASGTGIRRDAAAARVALAYCKGCPVWAEHAGDVLRRPPVV
ncbi:hypothetical protein KZZ52_35965 [Dactylosporangium sp. AC04546]|uniref:hypothetical protein n=1 Tax=Dactylosporangium sp. AC04546 TaxID=2862460 RepID=UPI001EDD5F67|nr:hypothetical protein [Dactylosporangium sp. AC04546]WVK79365.1 hypothetical protein KZZ52_35965 [Dactylosporangium sp. AC04546]